MNFFKFSFSNFNVFYLSSIIIVATSTYYFLDNNNTPINNATPCSIVKNNINSTNALKENTVNANVPCKKQNISDTDNDRIISTNNIQKTSDKQPVNSNITEKQNQLSANISSINNNSATASNTADTITNESVKVKRLIKKVSVQKKVKIQSTITQIDSVEVNNSKRKK